MNEISILLTCLHGLVDRTLVNQLLLLSECQLSMTGRVTMLGMSRWTGSGGSYRSIQRFFQKMIDWNRLIWCLISPKFINNSGVILIAGDATVVTKSGKMTYGLSRYYAAILPYTLSQRKPTKGEVAPKPMESESTIRRYPTNI